MMIEAAKISLLVFAAIVMGGGVMGFVKAKSKASIIAGSSCAALLVLSYVLSLQNIKTGFIAGMVVAALIQVIFIMRFVKTKKSMPAIPMVVLAFGVEAMLVASLALGVSQS